MTNSNQGILAQSKFTYWVKELEQQGQAGVPREIAQHKEKKQPIFYFQKDVAIMEMLDNRYFEYKLVSDKNEKYLAS